MVDTGNPCLACNIDQDCCKRLTGLKLTDVEYTRHFEHHHSKLAIKRIGKIYEVSTKDGGQCPNWQGQCTVYETRPVECSLFPYTIGQIVEREDHTLFTLHSRTTCPLKHELIVPEVEARRMVRSFAEDAYGKNHKVRIVEERGLAFLAALARRVAARARTGNQ